MQSQTMNYGNNERTVSTKEIDQISLLLQNDKTIKNFLLEKIIASIINNPEMDPILVNEIKGCVLADQHLKLALADLVTDFLAGIKGNDDSMDKLGGTDNTKQHNAIDDKFLDCVLTKHINDLVEKIQPIIRGLLSISSDIKRYNDAMVGMIEMIHQTPRLEKQMQATLLIQLNIYKFVSFLYLLIEKAPNSAQKLLDIESNNDKDIKSVSGVTMKTSDDAMKNLSCAIKTSDDIKKTFNNIMRIVESDLFREIKMETGNPESIELCVDEDLPLNKMEGVTGESITEETLEMNLSDCLHNLKVQIESVDGLLKSSTATMETRLQENSVIGDRIFELCQLADSMINFNFILMNYLNVLIQSSLSEKTNDKQFFYSKDEAVALADLTVNLNIALLDAFGFLNKANDLCSQICSSIQELHADIFNAQKIDESDSKLLHDVELSALIAGNQSHTYS